MAPTQRERIALSEWNVVPDPADHYSSGIADLDRLLGGGYRRGSLALLSHDGTVEPGDLELLTTPTLLNFLYQSRGVLSVLPARLSPHEFRSHLIRWVSRRRFDSRVRIVSYIGEDLEAPYVVDLRASAHSKSGQAPAKVVRQRTKRDMERMVQAEKAVRGARGRMFLEMLAFEIAEMVVGTETATRMFFHGIKRVHAVGNLCLGILRPGLGCADSVRALAEVELALHRDREGLTIRGIRPSFPVVRVRADPQHGAPRVSLVPGA
ncbi:MAG TPA: gas vesicle protein GvpD basic region 2 domain-containing protein [Thermoplasmata archaeon]|nr:gas vesicle protein GvpD basic region 2 domain-containing protein [Thermoplasmata archaeon]